MEYSELRDLEKWRKNAGNQITSMTEKLTEIEKALNENVIDPNNNVLIMELLESIMFIEENSKDIMELLKSTKTSLSNKENDLGTQMALMEKMFNLLKTSDGLMQQ